MALIRISAADVRLNRPVPYAIYSHSGKLLLGEGQCINSERQLERIFAEGAFRYGREARGERAPAASNGASGFKLGAGKASDLLISTLKAAPARAEPAQHAAVFPTLPPAFEGFRLKPDGAQSAALAVTFIGVVSGLGLLVSAPGGDAPGVDAPGVGALQPGVGADGHLLFGRDLYTFRTRVATRTADLPGVWLLDYPHDVRRRAVRRHRRVPAAIPAQILRNDSQTFDAQVIDISVEGVGLRLAHDCVRPGEHFRLSLRLMVHDKSHAVLINCVARNARTRGAGDCIVGAQLNVFAAETRALLSAFVLEAATGAAS